MSTETIIAAVGVALLVLVVAWAIWDGLQEEKRETEILSILLMRGTMFGLGMVKESPAILKRGTIYVTLGRLEQQGLVSSMEARPWATKEVGTPRRVYSLTQKGRDEALGRAKARTA